MFLIFRPSLIRSVEFTFTHTPLALALAIDIDREIICIMRYRHVLFIRLLCFMLKVIDLKMNFKQQFPCLWLDMVLFGRSYDGTLPGSGHCCDPLLGELDFHVNNHLYCRMKTVLWFVVWLLEKF